MYKMIFFCHSSHLGSTSHNTFLSLTVIKLCENVEFHLFEMLKLKVIEREGENIKLMKA
jgi:hypothetical protein